MSVLNKVHVHARAKALAYVIYEAPDLQLMERFMTDFGLTTVRSDAKALHMRGAGPQPSLHLTRQASVPRFVGMAFEVHERDELDRLAGLNDSSSVEQNPDPGGGLRVRMMMPDGFEIHAVWGRVEVPPLGQREPNVVNDGQSKRRTSRTIRLRREACAAIRLGHVVLHVIDHDQSVAWLRERFGLLDSDYFVPEGTDGPVVGTFLRLNRGDEWVDHHCMLVLQSQTADVHHCSFEVQDIDAVMSAHDFLFANGWTLDCGVGRHLLGSQVFDYWKDPFGFRVEHYTDGDVVDELHRPGRFNGSASDTTQWGAMPSAEFFK